MDWSQLRAQDKQLITDRKCKRETNQRETNGIIMDNNTPTHQHTYMASKQGQLFMFYSRVSIQRNACRKVRNKRNERN